jgi:uroporphyrinogen-III synthase
MRVIVTRPRSQAGQWVDELGRAGHDPIALPLIDISAADPRAVAQAWQAIHTFDAVMFVSANAAEFFCQGMVVNAFSPRAWVTGPGSVSALLKLGLERSRIDSPDSGASQFDSEALWGVVRHQVVPGSSVLIVRGTVDGHEEDAADASCAGSGRDWLANQLRDAGARVEIVASYQRGLPVLGDTEKAIARSAALDGSVWLFTSSEAISNLQSLCPDLGWARARALTTHPRIAQAAQAAGFGTVKVSRPALAEVLVSIESMA